MRSLYKGPVVYKKWLKMLRKQGFDYLKAELQKRDSDARGYLEIAEKKSLKDEELFEFNKTLLKNIPKNLFQEEHKDQPVLREFKRWYKPLFTPHFVKYYALIIHNGLYFKMHLLSKNVFLHLNISLGSLFFTTRSLSPISVPQKGKDRLLMSQSSKKK